MGLQRLAIALTCLVLLAGSFAAGFTFLQSGSNTEPKSASAQTAAPKKSPGAENSKNETIQKTQEEPKAVAQQAPGIPKKTPSAPAEPSNKPVTRLEVAELRGWAIGEHVTWVGKRVVSQSTLIGKETGTQHIFETKGPNGQFSFDYPFIAEEHKPLERAPKGTDLREWHRKHWGTTGIFTVSGVISRLDTLIMLDRGKRYDVPVLRGVKITINDP